MSSDTDLRELSRICEEIAREGRTTLSGRDYMTTERGKQTAMMLQRLSSELSKLESTLKWERDTHARVVEGLQRDIQRMTDELLVIDERLDEGKADLASTGSEKNPGKRAEESPATLDSIVPFEGLDSEPEKPILCTNCHKRDMCGWHKRTQCDDFSEWVES
jgi:hypothetical protein